MAKAKDTSVKEAEHLPAEETIKRTIEEGNSILPLSPEQKKAYNEEVVAVSDRILSAGRQAIVARWYIGRTANKLRDDAGKGGTTYGRATVDGFAKDIGFARQTVYRCIKLSVGITLSQAQKLPLTIEGVEAVFATSPDTQLKILEDISAKSIESADYRPSTKDIRGLVEQHVEHAAEVSGGGGSNSKEGKAEKRGNAFGKNSATGSTHKQVLGRFLKSMEVLHGAAVNALISVKEIPKDNDITDKAEVTLQNMQGDIKTELRLAIEVLTKLESDFDKAPANVASKKPTATSKDADREVASKAKAKAREAEKVKAVKAAASKNKGTKSAPAKKSKRPTGKAVGPKDSVS